MKHLGVAPYLSVNTDVEGEVLRVSADGASEWFVQALEYDLAETAELKAPWLERSKSSRTSAEFVLPKRGVTLSALWRGLSVDQQAGLTVTVLKTLSRVGPISMFPRSGVLLDTNGGLSLVPPFATLVSGAAKTWDDFQFDEYCIGGPSDEVTHCLAFTLQRLLTRLPLHEFFMLRTLTPQPPSMTVPWLRPLDELVAHANDEFVNKRAPASGASERWAATLAVLEDQFQQSTPLSLLVERAWPQVNEEARWGA